MKTYVPKVIDLCLSWTHFGHKDRLTTRRFFIAFSGRFWYIKIKRSGKP